MRHYIKNYLASDFMASLVVFLVALPLCMGIALASGVEPMIGLLSGIIGGIVIGTFAGCPLQVSGPAAGLAVMVFQFIEKYGVESLVPLGLIVGVVQIAMYRFKLAQYFRAISPALIKGMLAGIGLLILISQIHIALLSKPSGNGVKNILKIPNLFMDNILSTGIATESLALAMVTVALIFLWQTFLPKVNKKFPAPLFAILVSSSAAALMELNIAFVKIPRDLIAEMHFISQQSFENFDLSMLFSGIAISFVASAESLLCVNAVDKITKTKSDYNQEVFAQGIGNFLAGIVGALPITGVIVRSSANIESGGKTRGVAIMHGVWLFCLVFFFPHVLELVPISALSGILIFTGFKLLDLKSIPTIIEKDKKDGLVYALTLGLITATDLLTGVIVGFIVSLVMLLIEVMTLHITKEKIDGVLHVHLKGKATFLHLPKISKELERLVSEEPGEIRLDFSNIQYVDDVIKEEVEHWKEEVKKHNIEANILIPFKKAPL